MSKFCCAGIVIIGSLFYFVLALALVGTGAFNEVFQLPLGLTSFDRNGISWGKLIIKFFILSGLTFSFYGYLVKKITKKSSEFYRPLAVFSLLTIILVGAFADRSSLLDVTSRANVGNGNVFAKTYANSVTKSLPVKINNNLVLVAVTANINVLTVEYLITDSSENPTPETSVQVNNYSASLKKIYCAKNEHGENSYEHYGVVIKGKLVDKYGTLIHDQKLDYKTCPAL